MNEFERIFNSMYERENYTSLRESTTADFSTESRDMTVDSLPSGPQREYMLQEYIRPLFGKDGLNHTPIGTHPDFINLEGTDNGTEYHYVCTLFVDIKGSTRLSLLYDLDTIFKFKDAVIKTCVEVVRSFDGYVHRIMGDAVMAFFGGIDQEKEDAIANALNCSITLRAVLEGSIKPWMERNNLDASDFGFRIGCDFGNDTEVLWGSFGYANVGEVSATGLPVDMASKLQGLANKNQTMLGQGLLDFINWPDKYSKTKEKQKNGEQVKVPVVIPNLTFSDGQPLDYRMRILDYSKCMEYCALPRMFKETLEGSKTIDNPLISYLCYVVIDSVREIYISSSKFLEKEISLEFEVNAGTKGRLQFPLDICFTKMNHGKDVPEEEREVEFKRYKQLTVTRTSPYNKAPQPTSTATVDEHTSYRGLHTMKCEIKDRNDHLIFRDWIGVMIK